MLTLNEPKNIEEMLRRISVNPHYIVIRTEVMKDICERILVVEEKLAKVEEKFYG